MFHSVRDGEVKNVTPKYTVVMHYYTYTVTHTVMGKALLAGLMVQPYEDFVVKLLQCIGQEHL